jgi:hydroxymethylbilane synthase
MAALMTANPGLASPQEIVIRTTGDAVQDRKLAEIGGKGLFSKEIHEALADRRIDLAVHSLKDLETVFPPGIILAAVMAREDSRDALILPKNSLADPADPLAAIPLGGLAGTSSVRRQAQLLHARPDLKIGLLRGNVGTRLDRTEAGDFAASFLAMAGLKRLNFAGRAACALPHHLMLPAACQGIVGITAREDDVKTLACLAAVNDRAAFIAATAERGFLTVLDGSCRTPAGAYAQILPDGQLAIEGLVASADGVFLRRASLTGAVADAAALGQNLGKTLRAIAPAGIFA